MKNTIAVIVIAAAAGAAGAWAWKKYGPHKKKGCGCANCQKKEADNTVATPVKATSTVIETQPGVLWVPPAGMSNGTVDNPAVLSADGFRSRGWGGGY